MASTRVVNYILLRRHVLASSMPSACVLYQSTGTPNIIQNVSYCTRKTITKVDHIEADNKVQVGFAEVVKENTKSFGYLGVIIGGIGVTLLMFYSTFYELLSSKSPNGVYSQALKRCIQDPRVVDALGMPIKAYGEGHRRRTHISHIVFMKDGVQHMRMKFHIQGIRRHATVNLEVQENESGDYVYRYLYVMVDDMLRSVIKIEDNRERGKPLDIQTEFDLS